MGETAPFREAPRLYECPRCGQNLERVMAGVQVCPGCEGAWVSRPTIESTFGTPYWPHGPGAWWRRELDCPACSMEGVANTLTPIQAGNVLVDRCIDHGVWLDAGELGRLLDAPRAIELEALYEQVKPGGELPPALVEFRKLRDAQREKRAAELEAHRAKLAEEQAKLRAAEAAEREAERARREAEEARKAEAEKRAKLAVLQKQRVVAEMNLKTVEKQAVQLREKVRLAEAALDEARAALLQIDTQIEQLEVT